MIFTYLHSNVFNCLLIVNIIYYYHGTTVAAKNALPIGLQLLADQFEEEKLLNVPNKNVGGLNNF